MADTQRIVTWTAHAPGASAPRLQRPPENGVATPQIGRTQAHLDGRPLADAAEDIRRGLTARPKKLSPRYFYDSRGSALFERITRLPEYYLTRSEIGLIRRIAGPVMERVRPQEIVELGSGLAAKIRTLLEAGGTGRLDRYTAFDIAESAVGTAVDDIARAYPSVAARGVVGDFEEHLGLLPAPSGRRLVVFFGSTIGNLDPMPRHGFLVRVRRLLGPEDRFLLGVDLVKGREVLENAYNDAAGVTAEFNRNILRVVNRAVDADFDPGAFRHVAFYDEGESRIEMHLAAKSAQTVRLGAVGATISVEAGETIWTESSYKFTRDSTAEMLEAAGLTLEGWHTDGLFALAMAAPE